MNNDNIKPDKYFVEIKQSPRGKWYVGSVKIYSNNKEELKEALEEACNIATERLDHINNPNKRISDSKKEIELPPKLNELFVLLKGFRKRIAERENIPPYIIFHDSVLKELALKKPNTKEEMLEIKGIGETNFEKYGKEFLNFLIKH